MVRRSGRKLDVSPVWYQRHVTTPFSSPDTTRLQSAGDQWTADTAVCTQGTKPSPAVCGCRCHLSPHRTEGQPVKVWVEAGAHLVSGMLPDQKPAGCIPEAHAAIAGGADADVVLARMLAEGET